MASAPHPAAQRLATARATLADAARITGLTHALPARDVAATDAQCGKIAALLRGSPAGNADIDNLGASLGFAVRSALGSQGAVQKTTPTMTRQQASALITALQKLAR